MRQAPPVSVLCHGRGWRLAQAAVFGLAAAAVATWAAQHVGELPGGALPANGATITLAISTFIAIAGVSLWLLRAPSILLGWDGQQWLASGEPRHVGLMLHTGTFVLLRLRSASSTAWLAVGRAEAGPAWHGLLVALHATRPVPTNSAEGQGG